MNKTETSLNMKQSNTFIGKDGLKRTILETDQNNPAVKEYVDALKSAGYVTGGDASSTGQVEGASVSIPHDQLLSALYWVFDFMDRALINFYLVGQTAQDVRANKLLSGDRVQVAVRKLEWESGARRIADAFATPLNDYGQSVEYEYNGVPVILHVLEDSTTLSGFDTAIYENEYFKFPNPYEQFAKEFPWLK